MAIKKTEEKVNKTTAVAPLATTETALANLGSDLLDDIQNHSGFETVKPEDVAIPFLKILQTNSPECDRESGIDCQPGDLYNTVTGEVYGQDIIVIPCAFQKAYVEWVPRDQGGGFVAQHFDSIVLKNTVKGDKGQDLLPNGNNIVTTAYHFCLIVTPEGAAKRIVIPMTSTQLKKSRKWIAQMMDLRITVGNRKINPPMFSHTYPMATIGEKNEKGKWYGYNIGVPSIITEKDLYLEAKAFYTDVISGSVKTAEPPEADLAVANNGAADVSDVQDKF